MRIFKRRSAGSMFKRLFTLMTATMLLCVFAAGFSLMFFFVSFWKNDRLTSLADDALGLAQSVDSFYPDSDAHGADGNGQPVVSGILLSMYESTDAAAFLTDSDGRIYACSDSGENIENCSVHGKTVFPADKLALCRENGSKYTFDDIVHGFGDDGTTYLCAVVPFLTPSGEQYYAVCMQSLISAYLPYTTEFVRMIIFTGLIAVLVSFLSSLAVSFRMVKPIKKITEITHEYGEGNFSERISELDTYSELTELAEAFNSMADNLAVTEQSRSNFVANVSHELKTPLTSIKGYIEAILDGTIPPEMQEKYLNIVLMETERLTKLTNGLLTLNSFDTKKNRLEITAFDINAVIKDTVASFEGRCTSRHISIALVFDDHQQLVLADMGKIQQVLYNLLDNAIKFSPDHSEITIETTLRHEKVFISVKDQGIGIPRDSMKKIWERFYKTDTSRGKDKKGTGLGLSIVKEIITSHGEHINAISTEGVGTEFIFTLPRFHDREDA